MNNNELTISCPICASKSNTIVLNLETSVVDNSPLYKDIKIKKCTSCAHIYNQLTKQDFDGLMQYYDNEYALTTLNSPDTTSDKPGSLNKNTTKRFEQLYSIAKNHLKTSDKVLDIGCALGGFLTHLKSKGISKLYGIDFTQKYISQAKKNDNLILKVGVAQSIPFEDDSFDFLFMDQVLEHLLDPSLAFIEAKRVLKANAYFCIGVPNAKEYGSSFIFDFFWFLMKEHIQHFDIHHLEYLANLNGFELVRFEETRNPMMGDKTVLPILNVLFKLKSETTNNKLIINQDMNILEHSINNYLKKEFTRLEKKQLIINALKESNTPLYIWGIGREYLYLKNNTELNACNILALVDANEYKQKSLTVDKQKIHKPSLLIDANKTSSLLITASAYTQVIKKNLAELGYKGEIIEI